MTERAGRGPFAGASPLALSASVALVLLGATALAFFRSPRDGRLASPSRHAGARDALSFGESGERVLRAVEFGEEADPGVAALFISGEKRAPVPPSGGRAVLECDSMDPVLHLSFDPPIDANSVTSVRASLVIRGGEKRPQLRWSESNVPASPADWRWTPFPVRFGEGGTPEPQTVSVAVADLLEWRGNVRSVALALPSLAGRVEIDWIRFVEERPLVLPHVMKKSLGTENREAHVTAPGEPLTFASSIEPGSTLRFGYGVLQRCWKRKGGGGRFVVTARIGDGIAETIFEDELRPAEDASHRVWFDAEAISLARFGGRRVTFTFAIERLADADPSDELAAIGLYSTPFVSGPSSRRGRPPVVLVSLDTLRADHLPSYGYERDTAPRLDALAREGTLFESAMSQAPETLASHMSLFTGHYPSTHRVANMNDRLEAGVVTLACRFRDAGYHTVAVTEGGMIASAYGFDAGFDRYDDGPPHDERGGGHGARTFRRAAEIAESLRDVPLFLFVHTYQIHTPYAPPSEFRGLYPPDSPGAAIEGCDLSDGFDNRERDLVNGRPTPPDPGTVKLLEALYDEEIRYTDRELGGFVDRLRSAGILDRAVLAVTSDHGEEFLDRGSDHGAVAWHGHTLNEEMVHVPMIVRAPGRVTAGARVPNVVSLFDLHPTLLELAGVEDRLDLPARSLTPLFGGGTRPGLDESHSEDLSHFLRASVRTRDRRFILTRGIEATRRAALSIAPVGFLRFLAHEPEELLFDRTIDPFERRDLSAARPDETADWRRRVEAFLDTARDARLPLGCEVVPGDGALDEDTLRALGYIK